VPTYVDNVVVYSATLGDRLQHLDAVFEKLHALGIRLKPLKAFIGHPSVTLLSQRVDSLGLATEKGKIKALRELQFPQNLGELERYLGLTRWLRMYIPSPLQALKTRMLKGSPKAGHARRSFVRKEVESPTDIVLKSFKLVQARFLNPSFLHHFDPKRPLFLDVDASKGSGIGAIVYLVEGDPDAAIVTKEGKAMEFPRHRIQPIMFLCKLLSAA
jgi:hypothetical protein